MTDVADAMRQSSMGGKTLGIATVILGVLCMLVPMVSGLTVSMIVAILLIAAGIMRLMYAFKAGSFWKGLLVFLFGGISILAGLVMLARPMLGLVSLTMVLVFYFLVDGIGEIIAAFQAKPMQGWGWLLFGGIVSVLLAIMIWRQWPMSGAWAIGILVGVNLIFAGFAMIALGSAGEQLAKDVDAMAGEGG